ncbi:hypothetical protein A8F94_12290 [Bacillus sp. FJAT-27225]|uniref:DUF3905 domain-containing protein n=1 Tax=Bacillus sp. FJAT-27225 TaxID=1743144 RepID=UPI00080C33C2|nr:DUF3905 domain-containing protein [Bacillus sp. FJAT-27225]OCA85650.1 hypothetical protein A8F94_12290 [Bacillus sp. FJAT-27225]
MKDDRNKLTPPQIDGTMPHQVNAADFKDTGIKIQSPFINKHGVVIGDSLYSSPNSPLENWSDDTDPEIMAGEEWIHPTNDIGWNTLENRELIESKQLPQGVSFMHPVKDTGKGTD